jgi:dienelactone hydrolase
LNKKAAVISGWHRFDLQNAEMSHAVFVKGDGRGVVLLHELPGLTSQCVALGERLVHAKFRVYMPLLFGRASSRAVATNFVRLCMSREIFVFSAGQTSPIVDWLRALCRKAFAECQGPGVGVIGMCMTGNFAITLLAEPAVFAPVTCQPTLPFGFTRAAGELGMSAADLEAAKNRAQKENIPLLGFRFKDDFLCRAEKFQRIRAEFGACFRATELPGPGHSTLTEHFVDESGHPTRKAFDATRSFLRERLDAQS